MLTDFGPANWTSELRNSIPGFAPFQGHAYADFTYSDTQGQLTREWFGPEKATAWHGRWPRYHIEVKSTRGEENEPFHISRHQMATVRLFPFMFCRRQARTELFVRPHQAFALSERTHLGPDMYVIARVSRVGSPQPQCMVYLDPHRALFVGRLQYAADVFLQRSTDSRVSMGVVT
jgi:hypothetical protein